MPLAVRCDLVRKLDICRQSLSYLCCQKPWWPLQMDDSRIFPQQYGIPFPPNFMDVVRTMFKRLFRVYAHIYHTHFRSICSLGEEAHLNTCFKHFMYFTQVCSLFYTSV